MIIRKDYIESKKLDNVAYYFSYSETFTDEPYRMEVSAVDTCKERNVLIVGEEVDEKIFETAIMLASKFIKEVKKLRNGESK